MTNIFRIRNVLDAVILFVGLATLMALVLVFALSLRLHQVDTSKAFKADWMLWEKQPLPEIAQQLDSMGIGIAVFDPCANRPANGDFLSVMQQNIANLRRAYTN